MEHPPYPKPKWAVAQRYDVNGVFCDICECGVEHPNPGWIMEHKDTRFMLRGSHPCCGCCLKTLIEDDE